MLTIMLASRLDDAKMAKGSSVFTTRPSPKPLRRLGPRSLADTYHAPSDSTISYVLQDFGTPGLKSNTKLGWLCTAPAPQNRRCWAAKRCAAPMTMTSKRTVQRPPRPRRSNSRMCEASPKGRPRRLCRSGYPAFVQCSAN